MAAVREKITADLLDGYGAFVEDAPMKRSRNPVIAKKKSAASAKKNLPAVPWPRPTPEEYRKELRRAVPVIRKSIKAKRKVLGCLALVLGALHVTALTMLWGPSTAPFFIMYAIMFLPISSALVLMPVDGAMDVSRNAKWQSRYFKSPENALPAKVSIDKWRTIVSFPGARPLLKTIKMSRVPFTNEDWIQLGKIMDGKPTASLSGVMEKYADFMDEPAESEEDDD